MALKDPEAKKRYMAEWYRKNRKRQRQLAKEYYRKNLDKWEKWRDAVELPSLQAYVARLKREFGLTVEDWAKLFDSQNESCAICKRHEGTLPRRLVVDHCHKSGLVRGLLCTQCNVAVGMLEATQASLNELVKYLERNK